MNKGKKILILGGGFAQLGLINTAKEMGLQTIVVGIAGNYPGYAIADKVIYEDIFNKEVLLDIAQHEKVDGIVMACSDYGLETLGYINDHMHLHGLSETNAANSSDKMKMKVLLLQNGVNTAKFKIIKNDTEIPNLFKELSFPLIIKAVDLQGSKGVYICKTEKELYCNYKKSLSKSKRDYCIVEEFIEGREFGAQAFVQNGKILFVLPHGDEVLQLGETNVPIGHYVPLFDNEDLRYNQICREASKAITALGFDNCAVNIDFIEKNGIPYIIELTGRAGANSLPELMSEYLGFNYYELIIRNALGETITDLTHTEKKHKSYVMSRQLFSDHSGVVHGIKCSKNKGLSLLTLFIKKGDKVQKFQNSNDCIGRVIFHGNSKACCEKYFDDFVKKFEIQILPIGI